MFGYVQYEKPHLYIKDLELYKAMYCGLCKGIGKACGQIARLGLSYDATFFNVLLHNLKNTDVRVEKQSCFAKFGARRPMALVDELTEAVACFNSILLYYKLSDDVADEGKGGLRRAAISLAFGRAKKRQPALAEIVARNMRLQDARERAACASVDEAADATACMLAEAADYLLQEYATADARGLFYDLGKWIYLMDAADDYDKDLKKKNYNPFFCAYRSADKAALLKEHGNDLRFTFHSLFYDVRERLSRIKFHFNRDLIDNVLLRGLPARTESVVFGLSARKKKARKQKNEETAYEQR